MSTREALTSIQSRLSERMQLAQNTLESGQSWLAFELAKHAWLVPLAQTGEIVAWSQPKPVPLTVHWYAGILTLRGELFGVVDVEQYIKSTLVRGADNLFDAQYARSAEPVQKSERRMITLALSTGLNCAFVVDRMLGLRRAADFSAADSVPLESSEKKFLGLRYTDSNNNFWQELDLFGLVSQSSFLDIRS